MGEEGLAIGRVRDALQASGVAIIAERRDLAQRGMFDIAKQLADLSKVEAEPKQLGRRMTMILAPDRTGGAKRADEPEGADADQGTPDTKPAAASSPVPTSQAPTPQESQPATSSAPASQESQPATPSAPAS